MKKLLLTFPILCLAVISFGQNNSLIKVPSLGFGGFFKDYTTPQNISSSSLSKVIQNSNYGNIASMNPGLNINYLQGISKHIDFMGVLSGCFTRFAHKETSYPVNDQFLFDLDMHANLKLLTDNYIVNPYLTEGIGASFYNGNQRYLMANAISGAGIQFKVTSSFFVLLQTAYKFGLTNGDKDNLNYSLGFVGSLKERKVATPKAIPVQPPLVEKDTDGDGIVDSKDKCPSIPGVLKYNGCPIPDTDGDGINDEQDSCPKVPGVARYNGCPIPDTDGDGINDEQDSCPKVLGVARYNGCPIPDTDGDGINDEEDSCPKMPGVRENHGCPEIQSKINSLAKSIYFNTGTATISAKSLPSLNEVASIFVQYPAAKLSIEGYTDNKGNPIANKNLSQKRSNAIKDYFVKKGIDANRLNSIGYGAEKPVADNKTAAGRAQNRRVELIANYSNK